MEKKFIKDLKKYCEEQIESGNLPFNAKKVGIILVKKGKPGQTVFTYEVDSLGRSFIETKNVVKVDEEGNVDLIATKCDELGNPIKDVNGHYNRWIIPYKKVINRYYKLPGRKALYKPLETVYTFIEVYDDISFELDGTIQHIEKGGFLNITNKKDIYGISKTDFLDTYQVLTY